MIRSALAAASLLLLGACATPSQEAARDCVSWGYYPGTAAFLYCVQGQSEVVQQNRVMWGGTVAVGAALAQSPGYGW